MPKPPRNNYTSGMLLGATFAGVDIAGLSSPMNWGTGSLVTGKPDKTIVPKTFPQNGDFTLQLGTDTFNISVGVNLAEIGHLLDIGAVIAALYSGKNDSIIQFSKAFFDITFSKIGQTTAYPVVLQPFVLKADAAVDLDPKIEYQSVDVEAIIGAGMAGQWNTTILPLVIGSMVLDDGKRNFVGKARFNLTKVFNIASMIYYRYLREEISSMPSIYLSGIMFSTGDGVDIKITSILSHAYTTKKVNF